MSTPHDASRTAVNGFTYIEVLAATFILVIGMFAIIGLVVYGLVQARRAQGHATGMVTAMSIAVDPSPLAESGAWNASEWNRASYDLTANRTITCDTSGWVNGYYVTRHESSVADDLVGSVRSVSVSVEVREATGGIPVASYSTRLLRQSTPDITR